MSIIHDVISARKEKEKKLILGSVIFNIALIKNLKYKVIDDYVHREVMWSIWTQNFLNLVVCKLSNKLGWIG